MTIFTTLNKESTAQEPRMLLGIEIRLNLGIDGLSAFSGMPSASSEILSRPLAEQPLDYSGAAPRCFGVPRQTRLPSANLRSFEDARFAAKIRRFVAPTNIADRPKALVCHNGSITKPV